MAARNKSAGIRVLVYGMGKGKAVIEGLSVSAGPTQAQISPARGVCTSYKRLSISAFLAASLRSLTARAW